MRWQRIVLPTPFPVGPVNLYLILDEPLTLIDAGPLAEESRQALRGAFRSLGLRMGRLRRILLTHSHPDHCGLARRLQEETGAAVYMHPREGKKMQVEYQQEPSWLLASGLPPELVKEVERSRKWISRFLERPDALEPLAEGEELPGDGYRLRVLHTPGHTGGHVCFLEPEQGLLWCGDTLLEHITPNPVVEPCASRAGGRTPSLSLYLETLTRLAGLELKQALPGHGRAITRHRERIAEMLDHHRQRSREILHLVRQAERPLTPWQVAARLYPDVNGANIFLATSEVLAHLDVLAGRGLVREIASDRTVYFSA